MHAPAFVVLGTWALVLMFRDYSRELGLVGLSGLRLVRLPFGMAVHVRAAEFDGRVLHRSKKSCIYKKIPPPPNFFVSYFPELVFFV